MWILHQLVLAACSGLLRNGAGEAAIFHTFCNLVMLTSIAKSIYQLLVSIEHIVGQYINCPIEMPITGISPGPSFGVLVAGGRSCLNCIFLSQLAGCLPVIADFLSRA